MGKDKIEREQDERVAPAGDTHTDIVDDAAASPASDTVQDAGSDVDNRETESAYWERQLAAEKDKLLRTAAEYANYRARTEREKAAIYANAVSDTINEIIPIADNIDRALDASKNAPEEFRKGLEMISNQLAKSFEKLNITSFGKPGDAFDPEFHNAISSIDSEELESDTIAVVYQKGYKIGDKIIRHAMVQTVN